MDRSFTIPDDLLDVLVQDDANDPLLPFTDDIIKSDYNNMMLLGSQQQPSLEVPMHIPAFSPMSHVSYSSLSACSVRNHSHTGLTGSGDGYIISSGIQDQPISFTGPAPSGGSDDLSPPQPVKSEPNPPGPGSVGSDEDGKGQHKKRSRNSVQMEMNRIAQRQYRERKKKENEKLQDQVDRLMAEMNNLKTAADRIAELETRAMTLEKQRMESRMKMIELENVVQQQRATIESQKANEVMHAAMLEGASRTIAQQQQKLREQEEMIAAMKAKLEHSIEHVWETQYSNGFPGMGSLEACTRMKAAVMDSLKDANDVEGLERTLSMVPQECVFKICENILTTFQDLSPQMVSIVNKYYPLNHRNAMNQLPCGMTVPY